MEGLDTDLAVRTQAPAPPRRRAPAPADPRRRATPEPTAEPAAPLGDTHGSTAAERSRQAAAPDPRRRRAMSAPRPSPRPSRSEPTPKPTPAATPQPTQLSAGSGTAPGGNEKTKRRCNELQGLR